MQFKPPNHCTAIALLKGDKKETALNLAHASGMVKSTQKQFDLCEVLDKESLFSLVKSIQNENDTNNWTQNGCYLILDGKVINAILNSDKYKKMLPKILSKCDSVIACRLSPVQKSQLVKMMKENKSNITCAIGDGGNDVSMIQEAHVGLG